MRFSFLLAVIVLIATGIVISCRHGNEGDEYVKKMGMVWNTTYHITYQGPETLGDSITATLVQVGASLSAFDSTSVVSKINKNMIDVPDFHFCTVFMASKRINAESCGAFDPTLSPAITAWGFGKGHAATSDTAHLDSLRTFVGLEKITMCSDNRIEKSDPRVQLNFSAIAKGYGCDAVGKMLRRNGVKNYMVEIGGEIAVGGSSPRGGEWAIAIEKPEYAQSGALPQAATIKITDAGLATSGNYRNFSTAADGSKFGHTIDPASLRPATTDVLSATVIAPTCMEADAYATAAMVLGSVRAMAMADSLHLPVMLILSNDSIRISTSMKKYIGQ